MKASLVLPIVLLWGRQAAAQPATPYGRNPAAGHYQLVHADEFNRKTDAFFQAKTARPPAR